MTLTCRLCGSHDLETVLDLGRQPPANALLKPDQLASDEERFPLCAVVCRQCWLMQLDTNVAPETLFGDYVYFSSFSKAWLEHARGLAGMAIERFGLGPDNLVIEIASNDGYLLRNFVERGIPVLGIEPAEATAAAAAKLGVPSETRFFGKELAGELKERGKRPDVMFGLNVLAHVPEPHDFIAGVEILLAPKGTIIFEFPHVMNLLAKCQFDTIYHEHFSYLGLGSVSRLLAEHGLEVYDVEEVWTHGGSLRIFGGHKGAHAISPSVAKLAAAEQAAGLFAIEAYRSLAARASAIRADLTKLVRQARAEGKRVAGHGAAAKATILLNFCDFTPADIAAVSDANVHKQGRVIPGCRIPVVALAGLAAIDPDVVVIFPWNLRAEIAAEVEARLPRKPVFVSAIPELLVT
jgi:SAM-dependent methyltransferase